MPKITLAQFESKLCDPPANVVKAIPMIRQAGLDGSDMIMFPEMFTTGYELRIVGPRITELAEPVNGPTITALREAAKQAGVYVVAPLALYHDDLPVVPFNSAVLIDREGNVAGVYDKQHLWALERFYFRGGNGTPVFQTDFGTIGIMICYDMGYPEVARMLALQGAQIVLCPSARCEPDHDVWDINVPARALENTVFLCAVTPTGRPARTCAIADRSYTARYCCPDVKCRDRIIVFPSKEEDDDPALVSYKNRKYISSSRSVP